MKLVPVAFVVLLSASVFALPTTRTAYFLERETFRVTHQSHRDDVETPLTMTRDYRSSTGEERTENFSLRPNPVAPDFQLDSIRISMRGGKTYNLDPTKHAAIDLFLDLDKQYRKWLNEDVDVIGNFPMPTETTEDLGDRTMLGVSVKGTRTTTHYPMDQEDGHAPTDAYDVITESWQAQDPPVELGSRKIDPHDGEVVMKATKFIRGEQDPQLFRIPANYRVVDAP